MGLLDEVAAVDSLAFVDSDTFGETVVYTKDQSIARSIYAVVDRRPPEGTIGDNAFTPHMTLLVRNDSTYGVSRAEVNTAKDRVLLKRNVGDASNSQFTITEVMEQDAGMLLLRIK